MKATLEFNLPKEQTEFNFATKGADWWHVCWQMDVWLRSNIKHAPDEQSDEVFEAYVLCREELRKIIEDKGLNLDQ